MKFAILVALLLLALYSGPARAGGGEEQGNDGADGGDDGDGDNESSPDSDIRSDISHLRWPYNDVRGDDGHETMLQVFDKNNDMKVTWDEAQAASQSQVTRRHFDYYAKEKKNVLNYKEFMWFCRERFNFMQLTDADFARPPPEGHLKPLGAHSQEMRMDVDVLDNKVDPKVFWEEYVEKHKPVLFRGVDQGIGWQKWDEDYIAKHYGWVDLKIEPKIENRGNGPILDNMPKRLNVTEYFQTMRTSTLYAVSILPQAMAWDVNFPAPMLCGGRVNKGNVENTGQVRHPFPHESGRTWMTHLYEANLWLGYGRSRSQLHYDKESNVNCLYRGEKKWILIDTREYYNDLSWVRGGRFDGENDLKNKGTDWVAIDPDAVDLIVHKKFANVKYYEFTQKAGDCIFLPYAMLHWVNKTNPGFQAAVSYMWLPEEKYDPQACQQAPRTNIPMGAMDILWYFNGSGIIPQGYPDPVVVITNLQHEMRSLRTEYLTLDVIKKFCASGESPCKDDPEIARAHWAMLTKRCAGPKTDPKKGLHITEVQIPLKTCLGNWLKFASEADHEGMLPCDEGQPYISRPAHESARMDAALTKIENEWAASGAKGDL